MKVGSCNQHCWAADGYSALRVHSTHYVEHNRVDGFVACFVASTLFRCLLCEPYLIKIQEAGLYVAATRIAIQDDDENEQQAHKPTLAASATAADTSRTDR
jgi:uncharacterized Fe-S radical SAM superfamily protein PflX